VSNLISQLTTIDLDSLSAVTGGGGGVKTPGGGGGPAPKKAPGNRIPLGKRLIIGGVGLIGLLGGPDDVMPRPIEIPNFKPPITTSQPKFVV
jgi:hypothetical protein